MFIVSSAGKPIFTRHGDEDRCATARPASPRLAWSDLRDVSACWVSLTGAWSRLSRLNPLFGVMCSLVSFMTQVLPWAPSHLIALLASEERASIH